MNSTAIGKILFDDWPSFVAIVVVSILIRRPPHIDRVRRQLGSALNRFADVPRTRLDPALLAAAQAVHRGWRGVASGFLTSLCMVSAFFSFLLFRVTYPALPHWFGYVLCGLVARLLTWPIHRIERRSILHRLEHLHALGPVSTSP